MNTVFQSFENSLHKKAAMTTMTRSLATLVALVALLTHNTVAQSTLATVLGNRGDLDSFNELLDASGFSSGILRSAGFDGTVFAPNDDAFIAFPAPLFAALLDSEWSDHNVCFVSYHTVEGSFLLEELPTELVTIDGDMLLVSSSGTTTQINQANVVLEDIVASNGVAHILDDVLMPDCVTQNAYLRLNASEEYSTLVSLLETAGLVDLIATTAPITIFAPPNQAWDDMGERFVTSLEEPENLTFLRALLMNHVVSGNWYESRLDSDDSFTLATTAGTTAFFFHESSETNYITNSEIIDTDVLVSNGVIHSVSPVIILAAVADILQNAQVVSDVMSFSNFTAALKQANFFDVLFLDDLNAPRTTTVFAPDDEAFTQVDNETIAKLLDPNWSFHLREFLRYHLADGTIPSDALEQLTTLPTLTNFSLTVTSQRNLLMVDNATVKFPDLVAYNGVIHGIDSVLVPPSLQTTILEQVQANAEFSSFYSLLQQSSTNLTALLEGNGPMTLLVPTNAAFELLDSTVGLNSFTPQNVERILQYHVVLQNVFLNEVTNQTSFATVFNDQEVIVSIVNDTTATSMEQQVTQYMNQAQVLDGGLASNGVVYVLNQVLLPELPTESPTSSPAPTFDGYIAPSSSPSATPVQQPPSTPSNPTLPGTDTPASSAVSRQVERVVMSVVAVCELLLLLLLQ